MATRNEFAVNLEFKNMFSSTFVKTYDDMAIKVPNTSHLKNNLQYFCIHVSWDYLFHMLASGFSMQQTPHHGQYCIFLLNIVIKHIFYRYFLKILVILSSPLLKSNHPKLVTLYPIISSMTASFCGCPWSHWWLSFQCLHFCQRSRCLAQLQWCSHHWCPHYM